MKEFIAKNENDTKKIAEKIAKVLKIGDVIALIGGLGAGKTTFSKYLGQALGVKERITSPTFTIVQEYKSGHTPLFHFDVYRIGSIEEMEEIGYEEYFYGNGITVIEWADIIEEILPEETYTIWIETIEENTRKYKFNFDLN